MSRVEATNALLDVVQVLLRLRKMMFLVVDATPDDIILGGSGFGLDASADGEVASPVNLGVVRMDELFEAMSPAQVAAVQAQIVGSSALDIVGALSSMGVFEMDD